ncbi:MAG: hypothetical protein OEN23_03110 [Paracoccaceae bacterium]|nr:hypothetical protein [Paracoccaceae bacterium]
MTELSYDDWLIHLFDHPDNQPEWYFSLDHKFIEVSPSCLVGHVLRLFEAPALLITRFSDQQIASGLKYLIDNGCGGDLRLSGHSSVSDEARLALAERIDRVYAQIFAARCTPALGHLSEVPDQPLNMLCYMWWDIICLDPTGSTKADRLFHEALIEAMGRSLALPHAACQEGALHGLGHWGDAAPTRAEALIDAYLAENRAARPELVAYAKAARGGCIL